MDKPITPFGYAIFCDDIRQEIGNKISLMGLYSGVAVFDAEFPVTIPKLCIAINFVLGLEDERRAVKIKVLSANADEESLIIDGELPVEAIENEMPPPGVDAKRLHAVVHIVLSPFVIEKPGLIKVRAYYGDDEYKLGSLEVARTPWPANQDDKPS